MKKIPTRSFFRAVLPQSRENCWYITCSQMYGFFKSKEKGHERMKSFANSPVASSPADLSLMTQVRGALLSDPRLERCAIEVKCADGTVTLRGKVPKAELALRSQQLALTVDGVDVVQTELTWTDKELREL